jgi:hypothetical protein
MNLDQQYCKVLGIFNPYKTAPYRLHKTIPIFDSIAYKNNPDYRFVYDKLWIVQSQHMKGGELSKLKNPQFPIFIKPRWGHKTSSSKDCYKIKNMDELKPHLSKSNMMWSEFVDAKEGMTDFILINGEIVYQITYEYSEKQNGFADDWKYISPKNKPPQEIVDWVTKHMVGYSGPVNVQYRSTKIIEVGLRFARSGMYIESTHNKELIQTINDMWVHKVWKNRYQPDIDFEPYYSFKCWSQIPILCLMPQHLIDVIMKSGNAMPFYEYYFEPTGKRSIIFFQFLHKDFNEGMRLKRMIELLMYAVNILLIAAVIACIALVMFKKPYKPVLFVIIALILLSLDNSLNIISNQITHQKQFLNN